MKTIHIFGGGPLVGTAIRKATELGYRVVVRTGPRFVSSFSAPDCDFELFVGEEIFEVMSQGPIPKPNDFGLSLSAPWIIPKEIIAKFQGHLYNLHAQPLPRFRGAGGQSWRILMADQSGGVSIHQLTPKIDGGKVIAEHSFEFPPNLSSPIEYDNINYKMSAKLLLNWLTEFDKAVLGTTPIVNDTSKSTEYWPRLNTDIHGWIDWTWSLIDIERFCRAFSHPYPGAKTFCGTVELSIMSATIIPKPGYFHSFQRGLIFRIDETLQVAHPDGIFIIEDFSVKPKTYKMRLGDRLYTPLNVLEKALTTRIQYSASGKIIEDTKNE